LSSGQQRVAWPVAAVVEGAAAGTVPLGPVTRRGRRAGGPIRVLVFAPVAIRVRLSALRTLAILNVVIREAPG